MQRRNGGGKWSHGGTCLRTSRQDNKDVRPWIWNYNVGLEKVNIEVLCQSVSISSVSLSLSHTLTANWTDSDREMATLSSHKDERQVLWSFTPLWLHNSFNLEFSFLTGCLRKGKAVYLLNYSPIADGRIDRFMRFPRALAWSEM